MKMKHILIWALLTLAVISAVVVSSGSASDEVELNIQHAAIACRRPDGSYYGRFWPGLVEVGSLLRGDGDFDWCRGVFQWNLAMAAIVGVDGATFSVFVKQAPSGPGVWRVVLTEIHTDLPTVGWAAVFNAGQTGDLNPAPEAASFSANETATFVFDGDGVVVINNLLNKSDPSSKYLTVRIEAVESQTAGGAVTIFGDGDGPGSRNDPQPLLRMWRDAPPPPPPCLLPEDLNGDRVVDIFDVMIAASRWRVDYTITDIQRVAAAWGNRCP